MKDGKLGAYDLGVCTNENCELFETQIIYGSTGFKAQIEQTGCASLCPICKQRTIRRFTKYVLLKESLISSY